MNASTGQRPLSRLKTLRGMKLWNLSSGLAAVYTALTAGAYATGYALELGATDAMIGFLAAAPSLGQVLQMVSPLFSERRSRRKPWCLTAYASGYSVWLLIALIPFLIPAGARAWAMIALVLVGGTTLALATPAGLSWLSDLVPSDMRGRFIARNQSAIAILGLCASILAGQYMDLFTDDRKVIGFVSLFVVAVIFGLSSIGVWGAVPEPAVKPTGEKTDLRLLLLPFRHENFRNLTLFVSVRTMAVMVAAPFFAVYMLEHLHIPYSQIALYSVTVTVFTMLSNPLWGYLADKFGYKPVLRITSFGIALNPLPWFFATQDNYGWVLPLAQAYGGFMGAGLLLSQFNIMLKTAPEEHRSVYIGSYQAVVNIALACGSMLGGLLAAGVARLGPLSIGSFPVTNLQMVFLISALLRLLGLSFLKRVTEDQAVATRTMLRQVRSGNPLLTVWNLFRMARSRDPEAKIRATRGLGSARSQLAVDELIGALDDTDREVRREAARALGEIGDERATWPLITKVLDPAADIVEEAVESLGKIASTRSLPALCELLADPRPTVRKAVALALGASGDSEAVARLEEQLEQERDPAVFVALTEALSRRGGTRALHRLRRMLRRSSSGVVRRQLANSLGNLIGSAGSFYPLLQAEPMRQEEMVSAALHRSRRRARQARRLEPEDQAYLREQLEQALASFEQAEYTPVVQAIRLAASRLLRGMLAAGAFPSAGTGPLPERIHQLLKEHPSLRVRFGYLSGLAHETDTPLHREEALLAVFAFEGLTAELARLTERRHRA